MPNLDNETDRCTDDVVYFLSADPDDRQRHFNALSQGKKTLDLSFPQIEWWSALHMRSAYVHFVRDLRQDRVDLRGFSCVILDQDAIHAENQCFLNKKWLKDKQKSQLYQRKYPHQGPQMIGMGLTGLMVGAVVGGILVATVGAAFIGVLSVMLGGIFFGGVGKVITATRYAHFTPDRTLTLCYKTGQSDTPHTPSDPRFAVDLMPQSVVQPKQHQTQKQSAPLMITARHQQDHETVVTNLTKGFGSDDNH